MTTVHHSSRFGAVLLALAMIQWGSAWAQTASSTNQKPPGDRIIEQQLLEGLESAPKPPQPPAPGSSGEPAQLLKQVLDDMRSAEQRLAERDTSGVTQERQKQAVNGLARLLDQAGESSRGSPMGKKGGQEREMSARTGQGNPEPGTSSGAPVAHSHAPSASLLPQHDIDRWLNNMWGHLPQRVRNQLQAPRSEQFLPKYERTIEEYYLRLAEEQEPAR
jgi:hypothetical protein